MSSLVSGVGKIFSSIGTGVAKLSMAFKGVGAAAGTAAAATGSSSGALGGLFGGGGGILSNMFNGVSSLFGGSTIGTTAGNFSGPWGQKLGAVGVTSATGFPTAPGAGGDGGYKGLGSGLLDWAKSEAGGSMIAGLGKGIGEYQQMQTIEDMQATNLAYLQKQETDKRDSYNVDPSAQIAYNDEPRRRTPTARIVTPTVAVYNPTNGLIEMQPKTATA